MPFPPISWWAAVLGAETLYLDAHEHFEKMSYRNRYYISGSNGRIQLSVPLVHGRDQRAPMHDVQISNEQIWQVQHWRTLVSVYRRSPYFDYYEDSLREIFESGFNHLTHFNLTTIDWVKQQLKLPIIVIYSCWILLLQLLKKQYSLKTICSKFRCALIFYDERKLLMHYYVELYNTGTITKENYPITQRIFISKRLGDATLFNLTRKDTIYTDVVCPFIGSFSLKALPSGNYYLNTVVEDKNKLILSYRSFFFQVINKKPGTAEETTKKPDPKINETKETKEPVAKNDTSVFEKITLIDIGKTFAIKYNLNELKAILVMMRPIVSPVEMQSINAFLKKPDENYMRYFIYNHFSALNKKDPDAAWKAFTEKVIAVNKLFSSGSNMGYESDRGFVWLKYGKPDQRIEVPNESGALPYEVWQYNNIQGKANNVIFLFYQPAEMLNGYRLLHTTMVGEPHNNNWRTALFTNGNSSGDPSSRVEQLMGTLGSQGNQANH